MYQIYCDNNLIYDPRIDNLQLIEPILELGVNKTGSLTFKISPTNRRYNDILKLKSEISVYQDDYWLFTGRVLNDEIGYDNIKNIECEGELAYLIDTIQRNGGTLTTGGESTDELKTLLTFYLDNHNNDVEDKKKFNVGNVHLSYLIEKDYEFDSHKTTQDCIKTLIDEFGGYIVCRHQNNQRYIDYVDNEHLNINSQIIEFGKNIVYMTQFLRGDDLATAIIPKNSSISLSDIDSFTDETIVHELGKDFIFDTEAVEKYGWIYKVIDMQDVNTEETLIKNLKKQLKYYINPSRVIELTAFDLHLLNVNVESIKIGDKIQVKSTPHGLDETMIVNTMSINMSNPEKTMVELIYEDRSDTPTMSTDKVINTEKDTNNAKTEIEKLSDNLKNQFNNYNDKFDDYDTNLDDYNTRLSDLESGLNDTISSYLNSNFDTKLNDYLTNGGTINLSGYAKEIDVNNAFSELATLLNGV